MSKTTGVILNNVSDFSSPTASITNSILNLITGFRGNDYTNIFNPRIDDIFDAVDRL